MAKFSLDSSYIEVIAKILKEHDWREISINDEKSRITIKRGEKRIYSSALPMQQPIPLAESSQEARQAAAGAHLATAAGQKEESGEDGGVVVPAPVVGTVYLSPRPNDQQFVKVGAKVKEGQTLLIIEAMKIMNQIPAPCSGVIRKMHVANAQPVEFGDALVTIDEG